MKEEKEIIYLGISNNVKPTFTEYQKDTTENLLVMATVGKGMSFANKRDILSYY